MDWRDNVQVLLKSIRSDGIVFEYNTSYWGLLSIDGFDAPSIEVFTEKKAYGNGDMITGKRKGSREMEISADERGSLDRNSEREFAIAFHNSNYTYTLEITYMGRTRLAKDCVISDFKCPNKNIYQPLELTVTYLSPEADLFEEIEVSTLFKEVVPMWYVTRYYTDDIVNTFSEVISVKEKTIDYLGSEPAPLLITIKALGLVENVNIYVNGVLFKITKTMNKDDVIIVDVVERLVLFNGRPMQPSEYTSNTLLLLQIVYGKNVIKIVPDDEDNTFLEPIIDYTARYGGI